MTLRGKLSVSLLLAASCLTSVQASDDDKNKNHSLKKSPVNIEMFAPAKGDHVGISGRGWFVDLAIQYETMLDQTGFSGFQITGPALHNNTAPMPGTFSPGADDRLPGLVVLVSTALAGSCQNVANLFNLTGVTNMTDKSVELWDTWIIGAPNFGVNTESNVYVAVADDINGDGIYNDAPNVITDINGDGICNAKDLKAFGLASNIATTRFFINP